MEDRFDFVCTCGKLKKKKKKQFLKTDLIVIYHFTMFTYTLHTFDKNCDATSYHIIVNVCVEKLVEHNMAKT